MSAITVTVNGARRTLDVDHRTSLLDLLRERLGLTGSKKGCDHGQCGACTVLIGGRRANACLALAVACDGAEITTVEGLADGNTETTPTAARTARRTEPGCTRCRPRSSGTTHSSAATAPRASCARRPGCSPSAARPLSPRISRPTRR